MSSPERRVRRQAEYRSLCMAVSCVLALGNAYAVSFSYLPTQPVSNQPIALRFDGVVAYSQVDVGPHAHAIEGNLIRVEGCIADHGFATPGTYAASITVPPLPPGQYRVEYHRTYCVRFAPPLQLQGTWMLSVTDPEPGQSAVPVPPSEAFQYWHRQFNHYFLTANDHEKLAIETGRFLGWERIWPYLSSPPWSRFGMFADPGPDRVPVCRFFTDRFAPKSSHFYAVGQAECDTVKQNGDWDYEGVVGHVYPTSSGGTCDRGAPLYRLYNNGKGGAPNHRYTIDAFAYSQMVVDGWIPEGAGLGVVACVPNVTP